MFGHLDGKYKEKLKENYCIVDKGYNSFPTNLPGTQYNKAVLVSQVSGLLLVFSILCFKSFKTNSSVSLNHLGKEKAWSDIE